MIVGTRAGREQEVSAVTATRVAGVGILVGLLIVLVGVLVRLKPVDPSRPDDAGRVELRMTGYRYEPGVIYLPAETEVTLVLVNEDDIAHDFWMGQGVIELAEGGLAHEVGFFADVDVEITPFHARYERGGDVGARVRPDERVEMRFNVPAEKVGEWSMDCFTGAGCHRRAGLAGTIIVEPVS
jgi:hypothetical protein